jgi:hypothetical protein
MTVTLKQREPDPYTLEQHTYVLYDVAMVVTTCDGFGGYYIKVVKKYGKQVSYSLRNFDFEVHG